MVRVAGFEPTASWSRTKRATGCATPGYETEKTYQSVKITSVDAAATKRSIIINDSVLLVKHFSFWNQNYALPDAFRLFPQPRLLIIKANDWRREA